ncbi:aldo/keto reductase [Microbacterium sp. LWS13-1.2]|uniref:Aldo/keto reductase n=1 Tax=Microbacterium sp. LWS13-1.2 TaxID=3135264 RepID=A0AAU6SDU6_9MICO
MTTTLRRRWDFRRDVILRSVESSLRRLRTDRVDIPYLHDPDEHWHAASTTGIGALIELRDQGRVCHRRRYEPVGDARGARPAL